MQSNQTLVDALDHQGTRMAAIVELCRRRDPAMLDHILTSLKDLRWAECVAAGQAIADYGESAIPGLTPLLRSRTPDQAFFAAAAALSLLGSDDVMTLGLRRLRSANSSLTKNPFFTGMLLESMVPRAAARVGELAPLLRHTRSEVRTASAYLTGRAGLSAREGQVNLEAFQPLIPTLADLAENDRSGRVRRVAEWAGACIANEDVPALSYEEALRSPEPDPPNDLSIEDRVGNILAGMDNVSATPADDKLSWAISSPAGPIRLTVNPYGDDDHDLQITMPVMPLPADQRTPFLRRLLELNEPTTAGPALLFLEDEQVCIGVARGLEEVDDATLEYLVALVPHLATQLQANLRGIVGPSPQPS